LTKCKANELKAAKSFENANKAAKVEVKEVKQEVEELQPV